MKNAIFLLFVLLKMKKVNIPSTLFPYIQKISPMPISTLLAINIYLNLMRGCHILFDVNQEWYVFIKIMSPMIQGVGIDFI